MKKIFGFIITVSLMLILPITVKANSISNIDMSIYVDNNGTGHVTEVWNTSYSSDTELYKSFTNLGDMKISNFKVSDLTREYTYLDDWDINESFDYKAYKNGYNYTDEGLEICWGISKYGDNKYTITYDLEGFVATTTDADIIYQNLVHSGVSVNNVHVKIYGDAAYSDSLDVWGYGKYGGTAYVNNGYIEMNSEGVKSSDEYMTILVKFDKDTFNTTNVLENNFEYYHDLAEEDSTKYNQKTSVFSKIISVIVFIFQRLIFVIVGILVVIGIVKSKNKFGSYYIDFEKGKEKLPKDINNFRDIPFSDDIFKTYWISNVYGFNSKKTDLLGAVILRWLKNDQVSIKKVPDGLFKNKEASAIDLTKEYSGDSDLEKKLYIMMRDASKDYILESKEFEKWCKTYYNKILTWFDDVLDYETELLAQQNMLTTSKPNHYMVNDSLREDAIKLKGMKKFLEEFSRIDDREAIEVKLWNEYLMYAQILGIADKVAKQFKKLYPDFIEQNSNQYGYDIGDIIFINMMCSSSMSAASSSMSAANNYSAGGGGFMSGGGGGGSFGGGSMGSR